MGFALWPIAPGTTTAAERASAPVRWIRDIDEGLKLARESGRDVLINFTGHGWCHYCTLLERAVFAQPEFAAAAAEQFVLVELDFPRGMSQRSADDSDELPNSNESQMLRKYGAWQSRYFVRGFPTVVVADARGRPVAYTGYDKGISAGSFLRELESFRGARQARDRALQRAAGATGDERAALLDAALDSIVRYLGTLESQNGDVLLSWYADIVAEICLLDTGDALGLRGKYVRRQQDLREFLAAEEVFARLDDFKSHQDTLDYIERVLPTVTDPKMNWRLEYARQVHLEWDKQHAAAVENARRLLNRTNLSRDQRECLQDRVAFNLTKLGCYDDAFALLDALIGANEDRPHRQLKYLATRAWYLDAAARGNRDRTQAIAAFERLRERCQPGSDDWETATWGLALQLQASQRFREALALRRELVAANPLPEMLLDLVETRISLDPNADVAAALENVERWLKTYDFARASEHDRLERLTTRLRDLRRQSNSGRK
jgi:hypothetical protein